MNVRILAAAGALVSGAVHLKLWFDGTRDLDVVGPAFMVNAVAGLVIAVLLRHVAALGAAVPGLRVRRLHPRGVRDLHDRRAVRRPRVAGRASMSGQQPSPRSS